MMEFQDWNLIVIMSPMNSMRLQPVSGDQVPGDELAFISSILSSHVCRARKFLDNLWEGIARNTVERLVGKGGPRQS